MSSPIANRPLPALALLAGGFATRLHPITITMPKSLVAVAGEPFVGHQLRLLASQGVSNIVICCGHFADQIEAYVGDGARFGCRVSYSLDGENPLGTGGALRKALPLLGDHFFVMYGDSFLDTDFRAGYAAFVGAEKPALMTVFRNAGRWDQSNVEFVDNQIRRYDKTNKTPAMQFIDYGLGILTARVIGERPLGAKFDLADVYRALVERGLLAGYEVHERFYEIGSPAGLAEANSYLMKRQRIGQ